MSILSFGRVSHIERLMFTKHLSVMIKSGLSIVESLEVLVTQAQGTFRLVIMAVARDVENGQSLAKSLSKHPKAFDPFYVNLIKIAEESGTLEESLSFLAVQLSKDYSTRRKIQGALLYPSLILSAAFIMGSFISVFVLPTLAEFFEGFDIELPFATRVLLFFANFMRQWGIAVPFFFIALGLLFRFSLFLPFVITLWHKMILRLPLFGRIVSYGQLAIFSRNFGILLKSGVPVIVSLKTTAETLSNTLFRQDLRKVSSALEHGKNIADAMTAQKFSEFPPFVVKMVAVGEKTGKLDEVLLYLGDFYEDEIDNISKNLTTILEPFLLLIIGLIVGFVAIAIISPIYELTGSIGR